MGAWGWLELPERVEHAIDALEDFIEKLLHHKPPKTGVPTTIRVTPGTPERN